MVAISLAMPFLEASEVEIVSERGISFDSERAEVVWRGPLTINYQGWAVASPQSATGYFDRILRKKGESYKLSAQPRSIVLPGPYEAAGSATKVKGQLLVWIAAEKELRAVGPTTRVKMQGQWSRPDEATAIAVLGPGGEISLKGAWKLTKLAEGGSGKAETTSDQPSK